MSRIIRDEPPRPACTTGLASAASSVATSSSCNSSRADHRSRWKGTFAWRSSVELRHSMVLGIRRACRRSFRKYNTSSSGTATAAATSAGHGLSKVMA